MSINEESDYQYQWWEEHQYLNNPQLKEEIIVAQKKGYICPRNPPQFLTPKLIVLVQVAAALGVLVLAMYMMCFTVS